MLPSSTVVRNPCQPSAAAAVLTRSTWACVMGIDVSGRSCNRSVSPLGIAHKMYFASAGFVELCCLKDFMYQPVYHGCGRLVKLIARTDHLPGLHLRRDAAAHELLRPRPQSAPSGSVVLRCRDDELVLGVEVMVGTGCACAGLLSLAGAPLSAHVDHEHAVRGGPLDGRTEIGGVADIRHEHDVGAGELALLVARQQRIDVQPIDVAARA